ncbi:MAG: c-type cytochrome [Chloroflexi bacterium]|nr:c-type cytochrome [Chloroflexota bacterium]
MKGRTLGYLGAVILGVALLGIACANQGEPPEPTGAPVYVPPNIPHPLEGRSDCLLCHETGVGGAPQYPASHQGRPSDVCQTCHVQAGNNLAGNLPGAPPAKTGEAAPTAAPKPPGTTAAPVAAGEMFAARCAVCHGANRQGVSGLGTALTPESLEGRSDAELRETISAGLPGTAMPAFRDLTPEEIDALVRLIKYTPP